MNSSSSDPPLSPPCTKRQKSVTSSQLIAESQSLPSPVAHDASTGTPLTSAVEVPSPKRRKIVGPSRDSRRESSEDSAEGEDRQRCRYDEGRTRRRRRRSAGCEGNGQLTTTAMGSGESRRGRTTKATNDSGRPRRQRRHHRRQ
jgi:hypothetical protein